MNASPRISVSKIPRHSKVLLHIPKPDYEDAYAFPCKKGAVKDIASLTSKFFSAMPKWIMLLIALRDAIVVPLGLKSSKGDGPAPDIGNLRFHEGATIGVFKVYRVDSDEIVMGQNDKHLDFKTSVLWEQGAQEDQVMINTAVKFNNRLGRCYFFPVKFFHKVLIRSILKGMAKDLRHA